MKVSAPQWISSSTAMEADGPPIPVETTLTFSSVEIAGVGGVFPVLGDLYRVIEMFRNLLTAPRRSKRLLFRKLKRSSPTERSVSASVRSRAASKASSIHTQCPDAVKAGEIFKKDRVILEYMGMEIYSSINQMVVNFGDRLTRTVLKQLGETEKRVLAKYYKCKEDIAETARQLGMSEDDVKTSLNMVRINTGLDVNDTEDNFKLHFIMIAKKVLENDERIKKNR